MISFTRELGGEWKHDSNESAEFTISLNPKEQIQIVTGQESLCELLETFERFLLACGYSFDGHVAIVDEKIEPDQESKDQQNGI